MARIKTETYTVDGQEIKVNFNCSTGGVFSTDLNCVLCDKLGLDSHLSGMSLPELEKTISTAFVKYCDSTETIELKIAICFGACGDFVRSEDGGWLQGFLGQSNKFKTSTPSFSSLTSMIGLSYEVVMEITRNGHTEYYRTEVPHPNRQLTWQKIKGAFISNGSFSLRDDYTLINYSPEAMENLQSITAQLRSASEFLLNLVSSDDIQLLLNSGILKALK